MSLMDILKQYAGASAPADADVHRHFDEVARQTPSSDLGGGIAAAFRSNATPPFGDSIGNLFGRSNPQQQAGVLNQLIQALGPGALTGVAGGVLGRILGSSASASTAPTITPAEASQISPTDVTALATHAESTDPSVVDRLGSFYAEHPTLVKTLGAVALSAVLGHLGRRR